MGSQNLKAGTGRMRIKVFQGDRFWSISMVFLWFFWFLHPWARLKCFLPAGDMLGFLWDDFHRWWKLSHAAPPWVLNKIILHGSPMASIALKVGLSHSLLVCERPARDRRKLGQSTSKSGALDDIGGFPECAEGGNWTCHLISFARSLPEYGSSASLEPRKWSILMHCACVSWPPSRPHTVVHLQIRIMHNHLLHYTAIKDVESAWADHPSLCLQWPSQLKRQRPCGRLWGPSHWEE